jgi:hypothetical protein
MKRIPLEIVVHEILPKVSSVKSILAFLCTDKEYSIIDKESFWKKVYEIQYGDLVLDTFSFSYKDVCVNFFKANTRDKEHVIYKMIDLIRKRGLKHDPKHTLSMFIPGSIYKKEHQVVMAYNYYEAVSKAFDREILYVFIDDYLRYNFGVDDNTPISMDVCIIYIVDSFKCRAMNKSPLCSIWFEQ